MATATFNQENLPYFEDVLAETKTRRADWVCSVRRIQDRIGIKSREKFFEAVDAQGLPIRYVRPIISSGNRLYDHQMIALISELDAWKEKQKAQKPIPITSASKPGEEKATIILKEGSPIMTQHDIDRLVSTNWRLIDAVNKLTEAVNKMVEAWGK